MIKLAKIFAYFISLGITVPAAANQHEHLYSWFDTDAFISGYERAKGASISKLKVADVLAKDGELRTEAGLEALFGKQFANGLPADVGTLTLEEFEVRFGKSPKFFFTISPQAGERIAAYKFAEDNRKHLMERIASDQLSQFEVFLREAVGKTLVELHPRLRFAVFSVGAQLLEPSTVEIVKGEFRRFGGTAEILGTYPRYKLATDSPEKFQGQFEKLKQALNSGLIEGIDIAGSIEEQTQASATKEKYLERLNLLATLLEGRTDAVLKFHAFEASRTGTFYDAMFGMCERLAVKGSKIRIVIGHIAQLTTSDIERFEKLREISKNKLEFFFDANIASNVFLQDKAPEDLAKTIELLDRSGFKVGLGGDGQGILGDFSLWKVVKNIVRNVADRMARKELARRLIENSLNSRVGCSGLLRLSSREI